jgi:hypothetical protein
LILKGSMMVRMGLILQADRLRHQRAGLILKNNAGMLRVKQFAESGQTFILQTPDSQPAGCRRSPESTSRSSSCGIGPDPLLPTRGPSFALQLPPAAKEDLCQFKMKGKNQPG